MAESVGEGESEVAAEGWRRMGPPASERTEVRIMTSSLGGGVRARGSCSGACSRGLSPGSDESRISIGGRDMGSLEGLRRLLVGFQK